MDQAWIDGLKRLGEANERARRERLRSMTLEESLARFEELCASVHREFDHVPLRKTHPVGLIKFWKNR